MKYKKKFIYGIHAIERLLQICRGYYGTNIQAEIYFF